MTLLPERSWALKYSADDGDLAKRFYVPALECAVHYDRTTGFFAASALALAMRGVEALARAGGKMRLVVGCTLEPAEVEAIERGEALRDAVARQLAAVPLTPPDQLASDALELLAWMVARGLLDVKVAVPCDSSRKPLSADGLFHEKAGVITDAAGNRLAFNGSVNETNAGWTRNWESFNVFTSWTGGSDAQRVEQEEASFAALWADKAKRVRTIDVPEAARQDLLRFLPSTDQPARLKPSEKQEEKQEPKPKPKQVTEPKGTADETLELRRKVWAFIKAAPSLPNGGERVGEATCAVHPWPHQLRAFQRLYATEAPRLLIADEVGLGKTIQAGMLLRQAWLAGRASRILVMTPAAVMKQWQIELREKFNLDWPIYDGGKLIWAATPSRPNGREEPIAASEWHTLPAVITSSHLLRRRKREKEVCEDAEPWDLIVLDEAHHARRQGAGQPGERGANALLRLMRRLCSRTRGLLLLTATPMQVHPVEVWDLLNLLGLPKGWTAPRFLRFFSVVEKPAPSDEEMDFLAEMFLAAEAAYGRVAADAALAHGLKSSLQSKKVVEALRSDAKTPRRQLLPDQRAAARSLMRANTPVRHLISRHTRALLRRYYKAGKISTPIAERRVQDEFIEMTPAERACYEAVEDYIATTYDQASPQARNAVGFIMTVYRRRVASSFRALRCTLDNRLPSLRNPASLATTERTEEDASADESAADETLDADEAAELERKALLSEERSDVERLLAQAAQLPVDTKARKLAAVLERLERDGYPQAMVFTQYTDTMDFLREFLAHDASGRLAPGLLCFSGRGGEVLGSDGRWTPLSRDEVKRRFRNGNASVLLCTDAAAEGLNFQFCGALVNYDMPWNPMRVEQRIGRIDRLGQRFPTVRIVNLHYADTVETDVYMVLRKRINLFESVVGKLQPILSQLPRAIQRTVLVEDRETARASALSSIEHEVEAARSDPTGFELDAVVDADLETPPRPPAALDLDMLDRVIKQQSLLPPAVEVRPLSAREYGYRQPGMSREVRVTTDPDFFEEHAESVELWSPGAALFPDAKEMAGGLEIVRAAPALDALLSRVGK